MIDPHELGLVTEPDEKEYFVLFALFVSGGKTAWVQKKKLDELLDLASNAYGHNSPFAKVRLLGHLRRLDEALRRVKSGQYNRLDWVLRYVVYRYPECWAWTRDRWAEVHGIGRKTASFITMYTREDPGEIAVLDTWVLAWLKALGYPVRHASTPASRRVYAEYEGYFVEEARQRGMTVRYLDQVVWRSSARKERKHGQQV